MVREFKTTLPQINALRSTMNIGVNPMDGTAQVDVFSMPAASEHKSTPVDWLEVLRRTQKPVDNSTLSQKLLRLRSKYAIINGELEQDIVQIIVEEIGQGFVPK